MDGWQKNGCGRSDEDNDKREEERGGEWLREGEVWLLGTQRRHKIVHAAFCSGNGGTTDKSARNEKEAIYRNTAGGENGAMKAGANESIQGKEGKEREAQYESGREAGRQTGKGRSRPPPGPQLQ